MYTTQTMKKADKQLKIADKQLKIAMENINKDISVKIQYYQTLDYIKRKNEYHRIEDFLRSKATNTSGVNVNDFENELFEQIEKVYTIIKPYNANGILYTPPNYIVEDTQGDY